MKAGEVKGDEECKGIGEDVPAELMDYVDVRVRGVRVLDKSGADMVLPMHGNRHYGRRSQNERWMRKRVKRTWHP
jgi:hypothetical protein